MIKKLKVVGSLQTMSSNVFEVYMCSLNDEILYIGQGYLGRHKHCSNGCSHVYNLNKLHFDEVVVDVKIVDICDTKEDALKREKELILSHQPKFNTVYANDTRNVNREKVEQFNRAWSKEVSKYTLSKKNEERFLSLKDEFFSFYKKMMCLSGDITIYSIHHYKRINKPSLKALSRSLRDDTSTWAKDNYCLVFAKCFESVVGYSLTTKLHNLVLEGKCDE